MSQLEAFLLTFVLEVPVALLIARFVKAELKWVLVAALLGTTITHPILWFLNDGDALRFLPPWPRILALEVAATLVEGAVYFGVARMKPAVAWGTSLAANATSFGLGLVIYALLRSG